MTPPTAGLVEVVMSMASSCAAGTHPLNARVEELLRRWQSTRQELQEQSQALARALESFARGEAPEPTEQRERVERLRGECDQLFREVLQAVQAAKEAGVR